MCSLYSHEDFTSLMAGGVGYLRARRMKAHLSVCETCLAEWQATAQLWASIRGLSATHAPAALRQKIAAHLTSPAARPRPAGRRVVLGALGASCAAVVLAILLVPARPTFAFGDVVQAMESIQNATWTETVYESGAQGQMESRVEVWARPEPPAVSYRYRSGSKFKDGQPLNSPEIVMLLDERGNITHDVSRNQWTLSQHGNESRESRHNGMREQVLRTLIGPRHSIPSDARRPIDPTGSPEWRRDYVQEGGQPLVRFREVHGNPFWRQEETMWIDPNTRRVVRRELTNVVREQGREKTWHMVAEGFRYNQAPPPDTFDLDPPEGTAAATSAGHFNYDDHRLGVWDRLTQEERESIKRVISRVVTAWGRGERAAFAREWDFDGVKRLPAVTAGGIAVRTAADHRKHWYRRLEGMRAKPARTTTSVQNILRLGDLPPNVLRGRGMEGLGPDVADLLMVPTVVDFPISRTASTGQQGFFFLRKDGPGYKVVRWDFAW
jgi:hypothetical protein